MSSSEKRAHRPAYGIEQEAVKEEIEGGLKTGMDILSGKLQQKPADNFHNTKFLLKQYRRVAYSVRVSETELNLRMEMEHGTRLSTLELNAELAGIDLSSTKLEGFTRSVVRSKNMLEIINHALLTLRDEPEHGELYYQTLYLTYFTNRKPVNREQIIRELDREGFPMSMASYHNYLKAAIKMLDRILWGYTARDCIEIIKQFLPD